MMNGSGCKTCPVRRCTAAYRGSQCAANRDKFGLGDPKTEADQVKMMEAEELGRALDALCPECRRLLGLGTGEATGVPLTLAELKEMNGRPVWWPKEHRWGLVSFEYDGSVCFFFVEGGVRFTFNIELRKMQLYRWPPERENGENK